MSTQELQLAILHDVTSRLGDVRKIQLQKLAYFLQEAFSVPTKFQFKMHHYGPYAEALETDTARLKFAGYVDVEPDSQGYGFHITSTDGPREEWSKLIGPYRKSIERVIETFGHSSVSALELAATIHYMKKLRPSLQTDEILRMVGALKPKFTASYISDVHDDLERLDLLR